MIGLIFTVKITPSALKQIKFTGKREGKRGLFIRIKRISRLNSTESVRYRLGQKSAKLLAAHLKQGVRHKPK